MKNCLKYRSYILVTLVLVGTGYLIFTYKYFNTSIDENISTAENNKCGIINLHLEDLLPEVRKNKKVVDILKENCLWELNSKIYDFDGDGKDEIALTAGEAGCGSCHSNSIYIIKGDKIIFQKDGLEDVDLWPIKGSSGFILRYPIMASNASLCNPNEGVVKRYRASNTKNGEGFYKSAEWIEPYTNTPCILKYTLSDYPFFYQGKSK